MVSKFDNSIKLMLNFPCVMIELRLDMSVPLSLGDTRENTLGQNVIMSARNFQMTQEKYFFF